LYEEVSKNELTTQILRVIHYNASNLISVKSIDLALAVFTNDCKDDLMNWEFYDRYYDAPNYEYFPEEYPSFAPMVVNQLLNPIEDLKEYMDGCLKKCRVPTFEEWSKFGEEE